MRQLKITKQVTNRETASLDKYLQEIGKVDLITADEEVELAQKIKAGDQKALEKLTNDHIVLTVGIFLMIVFLKEIFERIVNLKGMK